MIECKFKVLFLHGHFYLLLPVRHPLKKRLPLIGTESIAAIAALDPGARVPFTIYFPEGTVAEVGVNCTSVLNKHLLCIANGKEKVQDVTKVNPLCSHPR